MSKEKQIETMFADISDTLHKHICGAKMDGERKEKCD